MDAGSDSLSEWLGRCAGLADKGAAATYLQEILRKREATSDPLALILFARTCDKFGLHHAGAVLYCEILSRHADLDDEERLRQHVVDVETVLLPVGGGSFRGTSTFLVCCVQRLIACLEACGIRDEHARAWVRARLPPTAGADRLQQLYEALRRLETWSSSGDAVRFLKSSTSARPRDVEPTQSTMILATLALTALCISLAVVARPAMQWAFGWRADGIVLVEPWFFVLAGVFWPGMLWLTWSYARARSRRVGLHDYIEPRVFPSSPGYMFGEIVPFASDKFFNIFQFIWVPFALFALWAMLQLNGIGDTTKHLFDHDGLQAVIDETRSLVTQPASRVQGFKALVFNDAFAMIVAALGVVMAIISQTSIQTKRRTTGTDVYWWDSRLDDTVWKVRMGMLIFDIGMLVYLLFKLAAASLLLDALLRTPGLHIRLFGAQDLGGQEPFFWLGMTLVSIVIVFGFFLMASFYLHRNVRQYRWLDAVSLLAFAVLGLALVLGPVRKIYDNVDARKNAEIERVLPQLDAALRDGSRVAEANQRITYIAAVQAVPSTWLSLDLLFSPVVVLLLQIVAMLWQVVVRGRSEPLTEKLLR